MASYGYEALNKMGKVMKGSMDADNEEQVRIKLKQQGFVVLSIKEENLLTKDKEDKIIAMVLNDSFKKDIDKMM